MCYKRQNAGYSAGDFSANSNEIKDRLVEPFDFTTNYIAIWAFDTEDHTCKTFKNAWIGSVQVLDEPWENGAKHNMLPVDVFRISSNLKIPVEMLLNIRACELLKEEYPLAEEYIQAINDN